MAARHAPTARPPDRPAPTVASGVPLSSEGASRYATAALTAEVAQVRAAQPGRQNHQLNSSAFALGQLIAVGALDEQLVRRELIRASVASGYPTRDGQNAMLATLNSGINGGCRTPRAQWPPVRKNTRGDSLTAKAIAAVLETDGLDSYDDPRMVEWLVGSTTPTSDPVPAPAAEAATPEELDTFLARFTRYTDPRRLGRRVAWMQRGALSTHARALVSDALDGYYPARQAVLALAAACRDRGNTDPAVPKQLLSAALGAALDTKVAAR